jgi:hypothetical protein
MQEELGDIVREERVRTELYLSLPPDEPLPLLVDRLQALSTVLPSVIRKHANLAWSLPGRPVTLDRSKMSSSTLDTLDVGFVTAGVPSAVELRYSTMVQQVYSPIPGCYVGIDHESIEVAIEEKRKKIAQYRCIARILGARQAWLLVVADASSPATILASHPVLWLQRERVASLSREPHFDAVYLTAGGSSSSTKEDLYYADNRGSVCSPTWEIFGLREGIGNTGSLS